MPGGGDTMTFARKSIGNAARIDCKGSCSASEFSAVATAGAAADLAAAGAGAADLATVVLAAVGLAAAGGGVSGDVAADGVFD